MTPIHYIAMSGSRGCLPDYCNAYIYYESAVNELADMFDLGRTRKSRLFADRYLDLQPDDGAEYCEIQECTCKTPWDHCDAGDDPRDWEDYPQPISCDQCEMLSINNVACHETGCPNMGARWDSESQTWVKQRKCFVCGCTIDADDPCCNDNQ